MEDTTSMVWDLDRHFYVLTREGVLNRLNKDVNKDIPGEVSGVTEGIVFLNQVSDNVKSWLYDYIRPDAVRITEFRLGTDYEPNEYMPYREAMEEALYAQVEYMLLFDGDLKAIKDNERHLLVGLKVKNFLRSAGIATKSKNRIKIPEGEYRVGY